MPSVLLGQIEATAEEAARLGLDVPAPAKRRRFRRRTRDIQARTPTQRQTRVEPTVRGLPVPGQRRGCQLSVAAAQSAHGLNWACTPPTLQAWPAAARPGRVTVEDFEKFIANLEKQKSSRASSMRVAVADAMRRSWTRPLATVGCPSALTRACPPQNAKPKPGPALYALRALALALAENSAPAGRLVGSKIVHPSSIDVGFAVEAEDGVLVPVIRNADKQTLTDLTGRLQRTRRTRPPAKTAGRRHRRLHRHRHQLRHLRPDMGHADSAAGANPRAGHGRGHGKRRIGMRRKASSCR